MRHRPHDLRLLEASILEVEGRGVDVAYPDIQAGLDHRGRYGKARIGGNHDLPAAREALQGPENERSEERRVGKSVDGWGRRVYKKKTNWQWAEAALKDQEDKGGKSIGVPLTRLH